MRSPWAMCFPRWLVSDKLLKEPGAVRLIYPGEDELVIRGTNYRSRQL